MGTVLARVGLAVIDVQLPDGKSVKEQRIKRKQRCHHHFSGQSTLDYSNHFHKETPDTEHTHVTLRVTPSQESIKAQKTGLWEDTQPSKRVTFISKKSFDPAF